MERYYNMTISYNGLWKILIDKKLQKKDLIEKLDISSATIAKMGKGEAVSVNVLERICNYLNCNIGDTVKNKFFTGEFVLTPKYRMLSKNGGLLWRKQSFVYHI